MIPLIKTPRAINGKATLKDRPIKKAAMAPVQPPVKGTGKAIKETKPIFPYFIISGRIFFLIFWKSQLKKDSKILKRDDRELVIFLRKNKIITTGIKLPIKENKNTFQKGRLNRVRPTGIEPFNSDKGAIAKIKIWNSGNIIVIILLFSSYQSTFARLLEFQWSHLFVDNFQKWQLKFFP